MTNVNHFEIQSHLRSLGSPEHAKIAAWFFKTGPGQYGEGDKFAGGFHSDEWQRNGITFKACENSTSENYLHCLPMLLSGRARLLARQGRCESA